MSDDELREFVAEQMIVSVATLGPRGRPHLVPLWYSGPTASCSAAGTYAKSQKAKNLERDPRATLQIEDGVLYHELRGAMFECDVGLERDPSEVEKYGLALFERYAGAEPGRRGHGPRPSAEAGRPHLPPHPHRVLGPHQAGGTY